MKLLNITEDQFPSHRADVIELFAKKMPQYGNRIDWLMQRGSGCEINGNETDWLGNKVFLIPRTRQKGAIGRSLNAVLDLLGDWRVIPLTMRNHYDVVQVRDKFLACIPAYIAARLSGAKFCYWMSYPFPESRLYLAKNKLTRKRISFLMKGYFTYVLLYGFIVKVADHVFVQSEQMLDDVAKMGVPRNKMTAVLMGVRSEQVGTAEQARAPNTEKPMLLYLGTLVRIRHLEIIIETLKLVRNKYPGAILYFVGDGENPEDRPFLEEVAERMGLAESVHFTGFLPVEQAWEYVHQADICFSPFFPIPVLLSTSPTKLIEYLAMGKLTIANEHPEQCKVLAESGVGHCIPWHAQAFANEVVRLLDNPEAARIQAARGPEYVRAHRTYDVIAEQVNEEYKRILS